MKETLHVPIAHIAINKLRVKQYGDVVYLENQKEFQTYLITLRKMKLMKLKIKTY